MTVRLRISIYRKGGLIPESPFIGEWNEFPEWLEEKGYDLLGVAVYVQEIYEEQEQEEEEIC